jgi:hypothetical protein
MKNVKRKNWSNTINARFCYMNCGNRKAHDTACDPDDIHQQLLKHLLESSHQTLLDLMNDIWEADNMP